MTAIAYSSSTDFRELFESIPGLYVALQPPDFKITAITDAYLRATMTRRDRIMGRSIFDVFPRGPDGGMDGIVSLRASLERVMQTRRTDTTSVQKYFIRHPDTEGGEAEERYWSWLNTPVLGGNDDVQYVIHRIEDVTEFVRLTNVESEQSKLNEHHRIRTGKMEAEIYRGAKEIQSSNTELRKLRGELETRVEDRTAELRLTNDHLSREIAEHHRTEVALRSSEEQLRQSHKLEAVGRLAGGIAHDFNNLLSVILSYSSLLLSELGTDSPIRPDVQEIKHAGDRAAELTRQLLAFSRQQVLEPRILNLNDILNNVDKMLKRVIGEDIELRTVFDSELGLVKADPGQIEQVIMNLVLNARDAMPRGGKLTLETGNYDLDDEYAHDHAEVSPGPHVMIAVSDTGFGMDKATQARVFEPFFTTKEQGKGTGLGLATVFGIVKQSGGSIWLYSEPGAGTTFKIYLPRCENGTIIHRSTIPPPRLPVGEETILLVEDEDQVRHVVRGILRRAGYNVLEAKGPAEASEFCEQHTGHIHLLLTDVVMPMMSGRLLAERVSVMKPGIRVLFMSGYTNDAILHHGVLAAGVAFLQKPLTPESITRKVRAVLDGRRTGLPSH
jgi:signal transduction histidine kinase/ActR/RegA family two-component response regulator